MSNLYVLDGNGAAWYLDGRGAGTAVDPFIPSHLIAVSGALPAGANLIGSVTVNNPVVGVSGTPTVQFASRQNVNIDSGAATVGISGTPNVNAVPLTTGGLSSYRATWPATPTGVSIKGSAGQLYGYYFYNRGAVENFVKLYNQPSAPTAGTNVPFRVYSLPPSGGANMTWTHGVAFSGGIGVAVTTSLADSGNGTPASGDVLINIDYF